MTVQRLVATLQSKGVVLRPEGGRIAYEAPAGVLTDELKSELVRHRAEVLAMLKPADPARLAIDEAMVVLGEVFEAVEAEYVEGALSLLDEDGELRARFDATERRIDAAVAAGPTEAELRAALAAHVEVLHECIRRQRARQERAA